MKIKELWLEDKVKQIESLDIDREYDLLKKEIKSDWFDNKEQASGLPAGYHSWEL